MDRTGSLSLRHISRLAAQGMALAMLIIAAPAALLAQGAPIVGTASLTGSASPDPVALNANFELSVNVNLTGVTGQGPSGSTAAALGAYGIRVAFDPAKVQFISAAGGSTSAYSSTPGFTSPATANANGAVAVAGSASGTAPTGNVNVTRLTFKALTAGATSFTITAPSGLSSAFMGSGFGPTDIPWNQGSESVTVVLAPGMPTNLQPPDGATNVNRNANLSWDAASGATSYRIYFGTASNPGLEATVSGTSYDPGTMQEGRTYRWRVEAVNSAGATSTAIHTFTTEEDDDPPPPECDDLSNPTGLTVQQQPANGASYRVSWNSVFDADRYVVQESTDPFFTSPVSVTINAPTTEAFFTHTVTASTTYYYRVRAVRTGTCADQSGFSSTASTTVIFTPGPAPSVRRIVPVVGSGPGNFGSFFKTSAQLFNPTSTVMLGKILFHPMGRSASATDPFLEYALQPGQTLTYEDIVSTLKQSGLGSLEFQAASFPNAAFRVFNDAGAGGTTGFFEELLRPDQALQVNDTAVLIAPINTTKARMNFGVYTLESGATLEISLRTKDGAVIKTFSRSYPANFFTQVSAVEFLDHAAGVFDSDAVVVKVTAGSAFVYGAITDNTTNDPAMQLGKR